jgi:hypothetical protein
VAKARAETDFLMMLGAEFTDGRAPDFDAKVVFIVGME